MSEGWWRGFFDEDYLQVWGAYLPPERTEAEADGIWKMLGLAEGSRVLDAPCGWGRLSLALAQRGARVVGVDQSAYLLSVAAKNRTTLPDDRLRYVEHDLRQPLGETGFDAAINVFSSIGYGTEDEDLAILRSLGAAVRPGGLVLVETMHRDLTVIRFSKGPPPGHRATDGTLVVETPRFDGVTGRVETTWYWSGPRGSGSKSASLRMYTATELVALLSRAGLRFRAAYRGCTPEPFRAADDRLGLVAERPV